MQPRPQHSTLSNRLAKQFIGSYEEGVDDDQVHDFPTEVDLSSFFPHKLLAVSMENIKIKHGPGTLPIRNIHFPISWPNCAH